VNSNRMQWSRRRKTTGWVGLVMLVVGIVAGPGYMWFATQQSGSLVAEYELQLDRPVALQLTAEMNPIGLLVQFRTDVRMQSTRVTHAFIGALESEGAPLWEEPCRYHTEPKRPQEGSGVRIGSGEGGVLRVSVHTFETDRSRECSFTLRDSESSLHDLDMINTKDLRLIVRRNVWRHSVPVTATGLVLAILGAFAGLAACLLPSRRPRGGNAG